MSPTTHHRAFANAAGGGKQHFHKEEEEEKKDDRVAIRDDTTKRYGPAACGHHPTSTSEMACFRHDVFNLIALVPVFVLNLMSWDLRLFVTGSVIEAWDDKWFNVFNMYILAYFMADFSWIYARPLCVKSPSVILKHHVVAFIMCVIPRYVPQLHWFMGACLLVEINTWLLIARRMVFFQSPKAPFIRYIGVALNVCFYVSWITIRCIIYPLLLVIGYRMTFGIGSYSEKVSYPICLFGLGLHGTLCVLNLVWTYYLFVPKIKRALRGSQNDKKYESHGL